jgi:hypothetical protein
MNINPFLNPSHTMRSYQHASRIYIDNNYRLSPKYGFLFYVEFDLNPAITQMSSTTIKELGMIVKSVGLPKFTIDNKIQNAYNRVNVVQTKIKYDPISINFHDDQGDVVRSFWYDYYSFFYRDSDYTDSLYSQQTKYTARPAVDWGYGPRPVPSYTSGSVPEQYQYIQAIRIYSLYQKNFSEYTLLNPTITSFKHGDHDNAQNEIMHHEMTIAYEAVKYETGYTTAGNAGGFYDLHYDNKTSPIARNVGANTIVNGAGQPAQAPSAVFDLANNNVHPGDIANNPLNTIAGFGSSLAGGLLNNITGQIGTQLGGLVSGALGGGLSGLTGGVGLSGLMSSGVSGLTSGISIPNLGSIASGLTSQVSGAAQALESKIAGLSGSLSTILGSGTSPTSAVAGVNLINSAQSIIQQNTQIAGAALQEASAMVPAIAGSTSTLVSGAATQLSSVAGDLTGSVTSGMASATGAAQSALSNITSGIKV